MPKDSASRKFVLNDPARSQKLKKRDLREGPSFLSKAPKASEMKLMSAIQKGQAEVLQLASDHCDELPGYLRDAVKRSISTKFDTSEKRKKTANK